MKICTLCKEKKDESKFYGFKRKLLNGEIANYKTSRCKKCIEQASIYRNRISKIRIEILERLGCKCVECGYSDIRALQIDHKKGGGTKHVRSFNGNSRRYYKSIRATDLSDYQILCANCNWIKRYVNKECRNDRN